jgi:large conductance mechanosensitive channel
MRDTARRRRGIETHSLNQGLAKVYIQIFCQYLLQKGDKMMVRKTFKDFKDFAMRGNVLDLAVAVILGGSFNEIVKSLVSDLFMPILSTLMNKINLSDLKFTINSTVIGLQPIVIKYGVFLNSVINFVFSAFCIFIFIKLISKFRKKEEKADPAPPTRTEELLTEIKDLLKEQ